jgi:hypothetical protein
LDIAYLLGTLEDLWDMMDLDGDGTIHEDEFVHGIRMYHADAPSMDVCHLANAEVLIIPFIEAGRE